MVEEKFGKWFHRQPYFPSLLGGLNFCMWKTFSFHGVKRPGDSPLQRILVLQWLATARRMGICQMPSSPSKGKHTDSSAIRLSPSDTCYCGTRTKAGSAPTSHPDRGPADSPGLQGKQIIPGQDWKDSWDKTLIYKNSMPGNYKCPSHQNVFCIPSSR